MPYSSFNRRADLQADYKRMAQSAADLWNKKQVAPQAERYLKDPKMLKEGFKELQNYKFKEWSCPRCGITVFGPKTWLRFHMRKCFNIAKLEQKSGEVVGGDYKLY